MQHGKSGQAAPVAAPRLLETVMPDSRSLKWGTWSDDNASSGNAARSAIHSGVLPPPINGRNRLSEDVILLMLPSQVSPMMPRLAITALAAAVALLTTGPRALADDSLAGRLATLEAEVALLRQEIEQQKAPPLPSATNDVSRLPAAGVIVGMPAPEPAAPPPAEIGPQVKKLLWKKGDFTITPYGAITASGIYETSQSAAGDYILYVLPPEIGGDPAMYFDAKSTRLGATLAGPPVACFGDATIGGRVEFDFQGQYVLPNKAGVLFRRAIVEIKNEEYRLSAGQDWELLSPLYPGMLNYVPGSGGGNLGYRRAMFRAERYYDVADDLLVTVEGSADADIVTDFRDDPTIAGQTTGWPVLEGRVAFTMGERKGPEALPIIIGVSGHVGQQEFDFGSGVAADHVIAETWSINGELRYPITSRFGIAAEIFTGANLGSYMGGVLQGIDRGTHEAIGSRGGWVDVWYDWVPKKLHSHVGYSIDDPVDSDLTAGRRYNHFIFGNLTYDVTKDLLVGVEASAWKTLWVGLDDGDTLRIELQTRYSF